ncbi:MAG: hypothetical protein A2105_06375 [Omnitrophica WOR_2 bacterium GWF2_63_9]|nr:MAG: hypothetical protein A2105_06375 [Omnitrophica WOR_2 bacterium GWF2_63_9]
MHRSSAKQWVLGILLTAYCLLLTANPAWTEERSSTPRLEEVVVSATRSEVPRLKLTKSVSVVTSEDIQAQRADTVLEVLRNVPGVYVRRSGSFGRTTSTVIRGSSDDQVLVLIDGVEAASPTLGSFNFANLPADFIERIEVLRGSASTLYGSKAIGGVINITTKRGEGAPRLRYQQEFGTLRTWRETLSTQGEVGPFRYATGVTRFDSRGLSTGDDVEQTHVAFPGGWRAADGLDLDVALNHNDSRVGIDDGAFSPESNRVIERNHLTLSTTATMTPSEGWESELRFLLNDDDTLDVDLDDPGTTQQPVKDRINTPRLGMDWVNRLDVGPAGLTTTGFELRDDEAESTGFEKTIVTWAWFLQHQWEPIEPLTLLGGVRHLRHNVFGHETTAETSASYRLPATDTRIRGSFSMGFRAPDLNDLFFPNFGNSNLVPEESRTFELGLGQDWLNGHLRTEVTLFRTEVDQLIQVGRTASGGSEAQNLNEVETEGFEVETRWQARPGLDVSVNWTYTDAEEEPSKEELVRVPKHLVGFNLDYDFLARWRLHMDTILVDHREEQRATNRRHRTKGYMKVDAALTFQATERLKLYGRVENLFDRKYVEVLGFPTAGTLFFLGGEIER